MNNMNRILIFITALQLLTANNFFGQLNPSISVSSGVDDNIFRSLEGTSDYMHNLNAYLEYIPEKSNLTYFYSGTFTFFQQYSEKNTRFHDFGINYFIPFGKDDKNQLYTGADFLMKSNQEEYNYYDYDQFYFYGNLKFLFDYITLKGGYNYRFRNYVNYRELTNSRHLLFIQGLKSFPTRTTIQLEVDYGLKTFTSESFISSPYSGQGRRFQPAMTAVQEKPSLSQLLFVGKIAQGLTDNIGLSAWYRKQISLTPESTFTNPDSYYQDEELFDDPFSFESDEYNGLIKIILPWYINLDIGGGFADKKYLGENAFISPEDTVGLGDLRSDQQSYFSFGVEKSINVDNNWLYSVSLYGNYSFIRNTSNSYWYSYKNNYVDIGLDINF